MTRREAILAVFSRKPLGKIPVSIRIELWYADAVSKNALPREIRGLSREEVEDYLGFCRAARFRTHPRLRFRMLEVKERREGDEICEEYLCGNRILSRRIRQPHGIITPYVVKYPLENEGDYDLVLSQMDNAYLDFDLAGFDELDDRTGDAGLPVVILHSCPAHSVMLEWAGYEKFFLHLNDFPAKVDALIHHLEEVYRRDLWPAVCMSSANLILHGNHFSTQMTPPPIFEKYFSPYFKDFNTLMHQFGKKVMWHADAEMSGLLEHVLEVGFDAADCLVTAPLVPQSIEDYFDAWKGKIVCWGGLPSLIFEPSFSIQDYEKYVDHLVEVTRGRNDFIFGTGDQVMPGAEWERLLYLAEATNNINI